MIKDRKGGKRRRLETEYGGGEKSKEGEKLSEKK